MFPGEIRKMIYVCVIASRELTMMRTCRQVSQEMVSLVDARIPFRMTVKDGDGGRWLQREEGENVQDVEINWTLPNLSFWQTGRTDWAWLDELERLRKQRRRCTFYLERCGERPTHVAPGDVQAWRSLVGFEEVIFRFMA